jgi:CHAD domain-containing protein
MNSNIEHHCTEKNSYCRYGAQTLVNILPSLEEQINGVEKGEDIEYLHKMRVTSRRIRAAMPLFKGCYPKKQFKTWLKEIKKVTRSLGEARDLDVEIIFLQEYLKSQAQLGSDSGVKLLHDSLTSRRIKIQATVVNELEELRNSGVLEEIKDVSNQMFVKTTKEQPYPQAVLEEASGRISAKLDDFLSMESCVHKKNAVQCHHKMRIRAKWLRYTLEAFSPIYVENFSAEIKLVKRFQDVLGEMHDCDVWIECIPKFINELETEAATEQKVKGVMVKEESLSDLLKFVKLRRKKYYKDFVALWDDKTTKVSFKHLKTVPTYKAPIKSENEKLAMLFDSEAKTEKDYLKMLESSRKVAQKYRQDTKHSEQVSSNALKIFDGLSDLHHLENPERCWLECAAILHDIGLSVDTGDHNKNSLKLILDDTQLPFSSLERQIIGSIARYHRKGFPKEKHYNLAGLSKEIKFKISILSGILRVADGLDYTHQSLVEAIDVIVNSEKIGFECVVHSDPSAEEQMANSKKDLLEMVFGRKLVLTWRKDY